MRTIKGKISALEEGEIRENCKCKLKRKHFNWKRKGAGRVGREHARGRTSSVSRRGRRKEAAADLRWREGQRRTCPGMGEVARDAAAELFPQGQAVAWRFASGRRHPACGRGRALRAGRDRRRHDGSRRGEGVRLAADQRWSERRRWKSISVLREREMALVGGLSTDIEGVVASLATCAGRDVLFSGVNRSGK